MIKTFLYHASGFLACFLVMMACAFGFGFITHTGIFA